MPKLEVDASRIDVGVVLIEQDSTGIDHYLISSKKLFLTAEKVNAEEVLALHRTYYLLT